MRLRVYMGFLGLVGFITFRVEHQPDAQHQPSITDCYGGVILYGKKPIRRGPHLLSRWVWA